MADATWEDVLQHAVALPEGRHMRIKSGASLVLLERRGDVVIALLELQHDEANALAALMARADSATTDRAHLQLLKIGEFRYVCDWRRQPADADWIAALVGASS